jgi:multiple sugar transport system permease protein
MSWRCERLLLRIVSPTLRRAPKRTTVEGSPKPGWCTLNRARKPRAPEVGARTAGEVRRARSARFWYLLLVPLFLVLLVVEVYPLAYSLYFSLIDYKTGQFVGAANYSQMLGSSSFLGSVLTSLYYSFGSTALALCLGILLAFQLSQLTKGRWFLGSVVLAPLAVSPLVVGLIFAPAGIWDDANGFWHFVLHQPFFNVLSYSFYFPMMIISEAWAWAPLIMLVAIGIMATIPNEVYEAASAHGASAWQVFRTVTLPTILRSPAMQFMVVIRFIDAMRAFEIPYTWSTWVGFSAAGSPTDTLSLLLFKLLFTPAYGFPIGLASAVAIAVVAITLAFTIALFRLMGRTGRI